MDSYNNVPFPEPPGRSWRSRIKNKAAEVAQLLVDVGTPGWLARPGAFAITILMLPFAVLVGSTLRRQLEETRRAIDALDAHVEEVWRRNGPDSGAEIIRQVFQRLDEQQKVFGSVEVQPYGRFDRSGYMAVLDWICVVERDLGSWDRVVALADKMLGRLARGREPVPFATEQVRTWVVRKAGALEAMGEEQEAKELLFSHIDTVRGDPDADRILGRTRLAGERS